MSNLFERRDLKRLEFLVANRCNLACTYCYAGEGTYCQKDTLLSEETVERVYEILLQTQIDHIKEIVFFGGEPLLGVKAIEKICELFHDFGHTPPIFKMISNFTLVDEEALRIISKYNIHITVSLDGPKSLNDQQRYFKGGDQSVYDIVSQNINLCGKRNVPISSIEATYTERSRSYQKSEIAKHFFNVFPNIHTVQVCPEYAEISDLERRTLVFFRDLDMSEEQIYQTMLKHRLLKRSTSRSSHSNICGAGESMVSVFSNGDLYPCHLYANTGKPIANVHMPVSEIREKLKEYSEYLSKWKKRYFSKCGKCNHEKYCTVCSATLFNEVKPDFTMEEVVNQFCLLAENNLS